MRNYITTGIEIIGGLSVSIGAFMIWTPLGFIVSGVLLIASGALSA